MRPFLMSVKLVFGLPHCHEGENAVIIELLLNLMPFVCTYY